MNFWKLKNLSIILIDWNLTLAVTNCSAERSFSCLKRVKNYLRSTMSANRLNSLAILCIESDVLQRLNCEDLIDQFANQKVRRVCLWKKLLLYNYESSLVQYL